MCGIAGIFAYGESAPAVDAAELGRIREAMQNRGPDGAGTWISPHGRAGLANRRLAIQDLSPAGAQPMATADGRYVITFNGEIYNVRELRDELAAAGVALRSTGDTEVILHLFARHGPAMLERLRGMYAFAIWDARAERLFLARDPFGIKPLYYADVDGQLRFASQVKALLAGGKVSARLDPAGVAGFFVWGCVPEPFTVCAAVRALPAGSAMWIDRTGAQAPRVFFSVRDELVAGAERAAPPAPERRAWLHDLLLDSLRHHLVADVPVGIFLSAGLDSSTLTAIAAEASGSDLHTLTLGFAEYRGTASDEVPLAEQVARRYATRQHTSWVTRADFEAELERLLGAMDQPSTDGVNTYFVSKRAAQNGMKVALSGLGGDELFGGYPSFRHVPLMRRYLDFGRRLPGLGRWLRRSSLPVLRRFASPKFAGLLEYGTSDGGAYLLRRALFMPWELDEFLDAARAREGWEALQTIPALHACVSGVRGLHARVAALELQWYMRNQLLRDADWAGMANSLEIRVPLVDHVLFRALAPLLVSSSPPDKALFASTPRNPPPPAVLERAKTGFAVPVREWIAARSASDAGQRGLRGWARTVLPAQRGARVLALVTDAFGAHGGIAQFNRDLLTAVCQMPEVSEVTAVPRLMPGEPGALPAKLTVLRDGLGGKLRYVRAIAREVAAHRPIDLIVCGHINLLPLAFVCRLLSGAPLLLCIHGIDAWTPPKSVLSRALVKSAHRVLSVSQITAARFAAWSGIARERVSVVPNAVHLDWYGAAPKSAALLRRHGLEGKAVIATLGRLVSEERYKGFDQVLDVLPALVERVPNLVYLIMGEGSDRARIERRVADAGLGAHVVFTGFVPESDKADHFRLADAYVMPSRGEGFGIVILEALACGVPVIGSRLDGTREALRDGMLGELVDPDDPAGIREAVLRALASPRAGVPEGVAHFGFPEFARRVAGVVGGELGREAAFPAPRSDWSRASTR